MQDYAYLSLVRALHVIGVVAWIGGVAFVTTVLIPALRKISDKHYRLMLFEQLEGRFALQARITTLITGMTGIYMLEALHLWGRYLTLQYWWLHLMTFVWVVFTLVLFVLEPLFLHRWFIARAKEDSDRSFLWLSNLHRLLLALSVTAIIGAVAGSHGFYIFVSNG